MEEIWNKGDFSSKNGMVTSVWGPSLWHVLHTISFNYPDNPTREDKENYYNFLKYLGKVLPCKFCRDNYAKNFKNIGFNENCLRNRESFSRCIYKLHKIVNKDLSKICDEDYKTVRNKYENFRARCSKDTKKSLGCTKSFYGIKQKCVLKVVPKDSKEKSFSISNKCKKPIKKSRKPKKSMKVKKSRFKMSEKYVKQLIKVDLHKEKPCKKTINELIDNKELYYPFQQILLKYIDNKKRKMTYSAICRAIRKDFNNYCVKPEIGLSFKNLDESINKLKKMNDYKKLSSVDKVDIDNRIKYEKKKLMSIFIKDKDEINFYFI